MDLLSMLLVLSMWACNIVILFPLIINASQPSTASKTVFLSQRSLISQMEAQSPGTPTIKVVHHQDLNKNVLIALIAACTILVGTLLILLYFWFNKWKRTKNCNDAVKGLSLSPVMCNFSSIKNGCSRSAVSVFEYKLIQAATNNFHDGNVLDDRACVYRARFNDKFTAAVKRFDKSRQDIGKEFENEINLLSKIHHQNLVSLLGYCIHGKSRFLVYEMMQKGSLETQLHGPSHGSDLNWHLRIKIAVDIARGLEYLHERCSPPVIHSDLKSSHVLLDSNFNAKLSGFGLAITVGNQNKNIKNSGASGYLAPEILLDGKLTDKSDVYAFGVILLELLIGRRPVEKMSPSKCQSIVTWAMPQLSDRSKLPNIMDPVIRNTMDLKHLYQVAAVAVLCVQPEPSYRPLITDVLHSLIPLLPTEFGGSLRVV